MSTLLTDMESQATSGILGMVMGGHNDRRQVKQQQKLTDIQVAANKNLTDYQYGKQLQMWKDTNYGAQKQELIKAGLNPALLYGMSGGGGTTTGSGGGGIGGATAAGSTNEAMGMMQQGIQYQLLQAQKDVLTTQAAKNKAEAEKTAGVDTAESKVRSLAKDNSTFVREITMGRDEFRQVFKAQSDRIQAL